MEKDLSRFDVDPSVQPEEYKINPENSAFLLDWDLSVGDPDYPTREDIQHMQEIMRGSKPHEQTTDILIALFPESTPLMFPQVDSRN